MLSETSAELVALGDRLRAARLRRQLTADALAQAARVSRVTVFRIEQGSPSVAMGAYLRVMECLDCAQEISLLAVADARGRQLQDQQLAPRRRRQTTSKPASEQELWAFKRANQRRDIEAVNAGRVPAAAMSWFTPEQARNAVILGDPL